MGPLRLLPLLATLLLAGADNQRIGGAARVFYAKPRERPSNASRCFIVKVRADAAAAAIGELLPPAAETQAGVWDSALHGFYHCANFNETQVALWANDNRVEYVEEDRKFKAAATQTVSSALWNLDRIDQHNLPLDGTFTYTYTGAGIYIYVVDTGVRSTHEQLRGRVLPGQNFVSSDATDVVDCNGHGTHVSATAAGSTVGVAKAATVVPVRVLDCNGEGSSVGIINALNWIATQPKPGVINLSLGSTASMAVDAAVQNVISQGFHVVVAAGNTPNDACQYSPARVASAITVGWSTAQDTKASLSAYGSCVDVFAPGSSIYSAWYSGDATYGLESGTSMSTALASGVVAALLEAEPNASPAAMQAFVKRLATDNVMQGLDAQSPNLLLYSQGNISSNTSFASAGAPVRAATGGSDTALYGLLAIPAALLVAGAAGVWWLVRRRQRLQWDVEQEAVAQTRRRSSILLAETPANTPAVQGVPLMILEDGLATPMGTPQGSPARARPLPV